MSWGPSVLLSKELVRLTASWPHGGLRQPHTMDSMFSLVPTSEQFPFRGSYLVFRQGDTGRDMAGYKETEIGAWHGGIHLSSPATQS